MAEMVAGIFHMGNWRSLEEAENSITMNELKLLMDARNQEVEKTQRFQAALKGIDLDEGKKTTFDELQAEADRINGKRDDFDDMFDFEVSEE